MPRSSSAAVRRLMENRKVRQFVKFCIVGASSTVVQFVVLNVCYKGLRLPLFSSLAVAFLLSVTNGFVWNRRWTFDQARGNSAHEQSLKFLAVNIVGFILNTSIVALTVALCVHAPIGSVVYHILAGEKHMYSFWLVNGAEGIAVCIVVFWNYFANRLWTFKH